MINGNEQVIQVQQNIVVNNVHSVNVLFLTEDTYLNFSYF